VAQAVDRPRRIPAAEFFTGVMTTGLGESELLVEAELPLLPDDTRTGFVEFSRRSGDFAIAMALAVYRVENGRIADARLGIGGAESRPRRIAEAERVLEGSAPTPEVFAAAGAAAARAISPMADILISAEYRRDLTATLVRRALEQAA
jgi:carbon-monoxide dehydrogenase medium subunit